MEAVAQADLPAVLASFFALHAALRPELRALEAACAAERVRRRKAGSPRVDTGPFN